MGLFIPYYSTPVSPSCFLCHFFRLKFAESKGCLGSLLGVIVLCAYEPKVRYYDAQIRETLLYM